MDAKQAMDSRKFCMLMDDLARTWRDKKATDQDKEFRLTALFLHIEEREADVEDNKARAVPRGTPPAVKWEEPEGSEQMTPEEEARMAAAADAAQSAHVPQETIIRQVIEGSIKGQLAAGRRTLCVPLRWNGRAVSLNHDRWKQCLEEAGIGVSMLEWTKDDRNWVGPAPVPGVSVPMVLM